MPRRITTIEGAIWQVTLSGRHTQYAHDEVSLEFMQDGAVAATARYARFAPRGAKSAARAFEEISDKALIRLLKIAQPAWTSPDGAYGQPT